LQHQSTLVARVLNDRLSMALNSRIIIEQAKGMVCQSLQCDMDIAFGRLRAHARNHNLRLTDVATTVVSGTLVIESLVPAKVKSHRDAFATLPRRQLLRQPCVEEVPTSPTVDASRARPSSGGIAWRAAGRQEGR
jgi:hypothetical protein